MDDTTFDYETTDVAAGRARFPRRPLRATSAHERLDLGTRVRRDATDFACHAWDESGRL